jgi:hypothetical protein
MDKGLNDFRFKLIDCHPFIETVHYGKTYLSFDDMWIDTSARLLIFCSFQYIYI